jgi:hypothetical protein
MFMKCIYKNVGFIFSAFYTLDDTHCGYSFTKPYSEAIWNATNENIVPVCTQRSA